MKLLLLLKNLTTNERRTFIGALAVLLLAGIVLGTRYFYSKTTEIPAETPKYSEGIVGQPIFINPVLAGSNDVDRDLTEILFADIISLSDRYTASKDGKTWNVFLKPDLKWSDGKPLTSDDVIFTVEAIQNFEARSPLFLTWQGVSVERISELEIEFNLRTPYAFFLDNLKELKPLPKHVFGSIPPANFRLSTYNLEPVGSGPYRFLSYQKRKDGFISEYTFEPNPNYPRTAPLIQELQIWFFQSAEELINAFNTRKIDAFGDLNPNNIGDLRIGNKILELNIPRYYAIFFNPNSTAALKDANVRTALELATDKSRITKEIFNNKATVVNQPILPFMEGYNRDNEARFEFSPEKAKDLLDKNGWLANATTSIREKKIGNDIVPLSFDIVVPQIPFLTGAVDIIKSDWQTIGVNLNPIILNPTDITNEVIKTRNYQMIIFGNILKNDPDIFSFWHSSERFYPGLNLAVYENKKVDTLLENVRKNFDTDNRNADVQTLQKMISDDHPAIFLFSPAYLYVAPKSFGGLDTSLIATPADRFESIAQWHLKTERVFKDNQ